MSVSHPLALLMCPFLVSISMLGVRSVEAQEFRIYTRIYNEGAALADKQMVPVVSRSLTLFHAGKVYDYIDNVGEVIIFEPSLNRFRILNTRHSLVTIVDFDEVKQVLRVAKHETEQYLNQLQQDQQATSQQASRALQFQLAPEFESHLNPVSRELLMKSPDLTYQVRWAEIDTPEPLAAYLQYADWMARLNYALHPQALYPAPREALNAMLREKQLFPIEVQLQAEIETRLHLRAEHQIQWSLDTTDRGLIHHWETLWKAAEPKKVTFREYQRAILVNLSSSKRR